MRDDKHDWRLDMCVMSYLTSQRIGGVSDDTRCFDYNIWHHSGWRF